MPSWDHAFNLLSISNLEHFVEKLHFQSNYHKTGGYVADFIFFQNIKQLGTNGFDLLPWNALNTTHVGILQSNFLPCLSWYKCQGLMHVYQHETIWPQSFSWQAQTHWLLLLVFWQINQTICNKSAFHEISTLLDTISLSKTIEKKKIFVSLVNCGQSPNELQIENLLFHLRAFPPLFG